MATSAASKIQQQKAPFENQKMRDWSQDSLESTGKVERKKMVVSTRRILLFYLFYFIGNKIINK